MAERAGKPGKVAQHLLDLANTKHSLPVWELYKAYIAYVVVA